MSDSAPTEQDRPRFFKDRTCGGFSAFSPSWKHHGHPSALQLAWARRTVQKVSP